MIKVILFDIGGVFFHQPTELMNEICLSIDINNEHLEDAIFRSSAWDNHKRGLLTEDEYWDQIQENLASATPIQLQKLREKMDLAIVLNNELVQLAKSLRANYKLAVLSNAGPELERRLSHFALTDMFEVIINSHYAKMAKPDSEIYLYTAERLGVNPENIFFVDDKERNTVVADKLGFKTHIYRDFPSCVQAMSQVGIQP
jgi:putative hydrolase of the HAD superfamily